MSACESYVVCIGRNVYFWGVGCRYIVHVQIKECRGQYGALEDTIPEVFGIR